MQSAAGGTSQRLNPALAMMRSRSRSPSPVPASPLVPETVVICVSPIFRGAAGALVMHGYYESASQFNELECALVSCFAACPGKPAATFPGHSPASQYFILLFSGLSLIILASTEAGPECRPSPD